MKRLNEFFRKNPSYKKIISSIAVIVAMFICSICFKKFSWNILLFGALLLVFASYILYVEFKDNRKNPFYKKIISMIAVIAVMVICFICINNFEWALLFVGALLLVFAIYFLYIEFKEAEIKNKMSQMKFYTIVLSCIIISYTIFCLFNFDHYKALSLSQTCVSLLAMVLSLFLNWYCGNKILTIINSKKKDAFLGQIFESIFEKISDFVPAILIIYFFVNHYDNINYDNIKIEEITEIVSLIIVLAVPSIKMYNFVLSEFDEYEKEHSEVNETNGENKEKKQYYDVEQFINSFKSIDDLSNLEKNINKKIKKLEKEKFAGVKRYVEKSATLKDLNSLEKIIAEKRDDLENNNDTEKTHGLTF